MLINGNKLAKKKLRKLKDKIKKGNLNLQLDILYIENSKPAEVFIKQKQKAGEEIGVKVNVHKFKKDVLFEILSATCNNLNFNSNSTGYLIQLPVREQLKEQNLLDFIDPAKDVDCLTSESLGKVLKNIDKAIRPAAVEAIISILKEIRVHLKSKHVTIVNDSNLIGKPLVPYLLSKGATVTICNEFTKDLHNYLQNSDIVVTAAGKPGLITGDMLREKSIIIDAATTYKRGKVLGDTEFESVRKKAKVITPVPGGVGPLTVACLFENLIKLHEDQS